MQKKLYAFLNRSVNEVFSQTHFLFSRCGYANGYVAVPPEHPLHGVHYTSMKGISIHGGITFSEPMEHLQGEDWSEKYTECIGFDSLDEIPKDYYVFGFDTIHAGDGPHLDRDRCISETMKLLRQLKEAWNSSLHRQLASEAVKRNLQARQVGVENPIKEDEQSTGRLTMEISHTTSVIVRPEPIPTETRAVVEGNYRELSPKEKERIRRKLKIEENEERRNRRGTGSV